MFIAGMHLPVPIQRRRIINGYLTHDQHHIPIIHGLTGFIIRELPLMKIRQPKGFLSVSMMKKTGMNLKAWVLFLLVKIREEHGHSARLWQGQ